jgi:hypothetical protein
MLKLKIHIHEIGYTRNQTKTRTANNTICVGYSSAKTNTNNVNKTRDLLQTPSISSNVYFLLFDMVDVTW